MSAPHADTVRWVMCVTMAVFFVYMLVVEVANTTRAPRSYECPKPGDYGAYWRSPMPSEYQWRMEGEVNWALLNGCYGR